MPTPSSHPEWQPWAKVMEFFDAPALLADAGGRVLLMNKAAASLTGGLAARRPVPTLDRLLRLDPKAARRVLAPRRTQGRQRDTAWHTFACATAPDGLGPLTIRRAFVRLGPRAWGCLLTLETERRWDQPYSDLLTGSPLVFFETDRTGRMTYGAGQMARVLDRATDDVAGRALLDLVVPEHRAMLQDQWKQMLKGEPRRGLELHLVNTRGDPQPFWITLAPLRDKRAAVRGVRGIASDLSAQKSLAYALEAAEERFNVLFGQSSDPILILSLEGDILLANPAFENLIGVTSHDLFCGEKSWSHFVHPDDWPALQAALQECVRRQENRVVEFRMRNADQRVVWYEQTHSFLHDEKGQAKGILAVARNIDRYKRREQALSEQAELMRHRHARAQLLLAELKELFALTGTQPGLTRSFLDGVCDMLHDLFHPFAVFIDVRQGEQRRVHVGQHSAPGLVDEGGAFRIGPLADTVYESRAPFYSNTLDQTPPFNRQAALRALNLKTFLGAPLSDSAGRIWGVIGLVDTRNLAFESMDIELLTIAALQVAGRLWSDEQDELKHKLEEHLRQAQKMEAVGMLAGGIAHDFNNVLSGILGFASYLLAKAEPGSNLHRDLGMIEQSAMRGADMTRQLLAFARRKHFAKEPVAVNRVVQDVLGLLQRSLSRNITIREQLADGLPPVLGDLGQLNQVVMNLCLNAAESMAGRSGTLTIATARRRLTRKERGILTRLKEQDYVCVTVSDTGVGMTREVQEHIFDPFFTTKSAKGGTGLGLSIVYGIVTNHNGDIMVESEEGRGSTFCVYLPAHRQATTAPAPAAPEPLPLDGTETVLVIEDEPIIRQMVGAILKDHGYQVVTAESGEQGVEMFCDLAARVDLVLLDMVMPGMDGEDTFRALRRLNPAARVLLCSGFAREDVCDSLIDKGAVGLVHKPYTSDTLLRAVRRVLNARGGAQEPVRA